MPEYLLNSVPFFLSFFVVALVAAPDPSTVEVVDVEDIPMAYLGDALCIRVKAVGDLML